MWVLVSFNDQKCNTTHLCFNGVSWVNVRRVRRGGLGGSTPPPPPLWRRFFFFLFFFCFFFFFFFFCCLSPRRSTDGTHVPLPTYWRWWRSGKKVSESPRPSAFLGLARPSTLATGENHPLYKILRTLVVNVLGKGQSPPPSILPNPLHNVYITRIFCFSFWVGEGALTYYW